MLEKTDLRLLVILVLCKDLEEYILILYQKKISAENQFNLCLDDKQDKVLKHPQQSCTSGNSASGMGGRRVEKIHLGSLAGQAF